jgi:hypothetical protein
MTLAVPIIIYVGAIISLLLCLGFGLLGAVLDRPYRPATWGQIGVSFLAFIFGIGAWIGFPAGTISLIIWAVLTIAGS